MSLVNHTEVKDGKRFDAPAVVFCAVMVGASLLVPANLVVVGPLRSVGSVSRLLGLVALGLLLVVFMQREAARSAWGRGGAGTSMVPVTLIVYAIAIVGLFGASYRRLLSPEEVDGSFRFLISTAALVGAGLLIAIFTTDRRGLHWVMGALAAGAGFSALVGTVQSRLAFDLAASVRPPGFVVNRDVETSIRNDLTRVLGSAGHPIEFSVVVAGAVPVALHLATHAQTRGRRQAAGLVASLLLIALPFGISRTGVLVVGIALLLYSVVWTWRQRMTALAVAVVGMVFYRVVQPGVLGTILGLFTNADTDNSITGRTQDYPRLEAILEGHDVLGIGPGTFQPSVYFILDNQFLATLAEGGIVGIVTFIAIPVAGLLAAQLARRRTEDPVLRDAAQAIFAALAATTVSGLTFDLLSFQQASFLLFVYTGLAGAILAMATPFTADAFVGLSEKAPT